MSGDIRMRARLRIGNSTPYLLDDLTRCHKEQRMERLKFLAEIGAQLTAEHKTLSCDQANADWIVQKTVQEKTKDRGEDSPAPENPRDISVAGYHRALSSTILTFEEPES